MNLNPLGSSAVLVFAAVLWFVYLIPTWLRRREYLATERNAVRLQQTLRIMAETAQVPAQVRAETSARSVATHERILRKEQQVEHAIAKAQEALAARAAAQRLAAARPMIQAAARTSPAAARRLRRSRAATSLVLLSALVAAGFGVPLAIAGAPALLATAVLVAVGAFALLGQMARVARERRELARRLRTAPVMHARTTQVSPAKADAPAREWTPVPLPKPLYLSAPAPARLTPGAPRVGVATLPEEARRVGVATLPEEARQGRLEGDERDLQAAVAKAEQALREAHIAANVTPIIRPTEEEPAAPSRFARMGLVDSLDASVTDLDAVLRRRRAV